MAELFARVSVLMAAAFALGLAVGWAFWRFQRRSMPLSEWRATREELTELRHQLDAALAGREALVDVIGGSRQQVLRLTEAVTTSWNERNQLRRRLAEREAALARCTAELEQLAALTEHLQRRVVELNALAAQSLDVEHQPLARPALARPGASGGIRAIPPPAPEDVPLPG